LPSTIHTTRSACASHSGEAVTTRVEARARVAVTRSAMSDSVCESTAEVGSTASSVSGAAASARARRSRWRCPPERFRPPSATCASSVAPSPVYTSWAQAVSIAASAAFGSTRSAAPSVPANRWSSSVSSMIRSRTSASAYVSKGFAPQTASEAR
jgi:hypothetical protein